jgi:hypothetical protein
MTDINEVLENNAVSDEMLQDVMGGGGFFINVTSRCWEASKKDAQQAAAIEADTNSRKGTYSVYKKILVGVPEYSALKSAINAVGTEKRRHSTRLCGKGEQGPGYVPLVDKDANTNVLEIQVAMAGAENRVDIAKEAFLAVFPEAKANAIANSDSITEADFPSEDVLADMFYARVSYTPVPRLGTWAGMCIPAAAAKEFARRHAEDQVEGMRHAITDIHDNVLSELDRTVTQLTKASSGEKGSKLFATLVTTLRTQVRMLEATNVDNNLGIAAIVYRINTELVPVGREAQDYKSLSLASDTLGAAEEIKRQFVAVVGAPIEAPPPAVSSPAPVQDEAQLEAAISAPEFVPPPVPPPPSVDAATDVDDLLNSVDFNWT